ncbi:MAG TPA: citrate synthase/methylcitrate synthase [Nitrolancea sp.]|nr:citrate synthase/methylcitrate synthase [Nitrolancea sp.]
MSAATSQSTAFRAGLEGVIAAVTRLSDVDGQAGELILRGFPLEEIASRANFEELVYLFWHGQLPNAAQLADFQAALAAQRELPEATQALLAAAAARKLPPMDALRVAVDSLSLELASASGDLAVATGLLARAPVIVAAYSRLLAGLPPVAPDPALGHAANYLFMLSGEPPSAARVRALDTYLNTVIDHGLNASTFAARVIVATQSDLVSAIVGALGALKGPLHGGAPGPALDMVFEIGSVERAEPYLRAKLERGERLMGFGHRVYKTRDPRADVLAAAAARLFEAGAGDPQLYALVRAVEERALALLEEYKPGCHLRTNVEFYTALLLHALELPVELFTPTFAVSRTAGWLAHCFEQQAANRLIRPLSAYDGPRDRRWVAIEAR